MRRNPGTRKPGGEPSRRPWTTRAVAGIGVALLGAGVLPGLPTTPAGAAVGQGFDLNASDLRFILAQIKIAEEHARTATADNPCGTLLGPVGAPAGPNQIENDNATGHLLPFGLRTVDGSCNNLLAGNEEFGTADLPFPRLAPANFRGADAVPAPFPGAGAPTSYAQTSGSVFDADPRTVSNLIVDQTEANPAAVAAAGLDAQPDETGTLLIPNVATDEGLSAPFNSWFTLFGQFFDHGLDLTNKGGAGTVFMPLAADDPLLVGGDGLPGTADDPATVPPANQRFMVLTRATNAPGSRDAINQTSSFIDQSQTYTSHPSHQVFLRQYVTNADGRPVSDGHMLEGEDGGLATWAAAKEQASSLLGIELTDADIFNVPLLATDAYGKFVPGPDRGLPQLVTADGLVEGDVAAPVSTATAARTGHAFLDDIAHHAVPGTYDPDGNPATRETLPQTADTDPGTGDDGVASTYDDEMLAAHFVAGDGRINENIGLSAVHQVFHSEHNRLVGDIKDTLVAETTPEFQAEFRDTAGADGWNGERLFQAARFVTEMEYQHLAFEEFARKVQPMINLFGAYDPDIDPAISAEFAHSVYRFGHSMLTESVDRTRPDGSRDDIPLFDAFLNPPAYASDDGLTPQQATGNIVRGMTEQVGNEIDEFVTDALRNRLVGLPLDLAALNIARGRDTGLPSLNEARRAFSAQTNGDSALAPYPNWLDFGLALKHPESLINFVAAYGTHPTITGTIAQKRAAAARLVAGDPLDALTPDDAVAFMNGIEHREPATIDEATGEEALGAVIHSTWVSGPGGVTTTGLDDVDMWVGGLAEEQSPFGGLLGSTMNHVFETDMEDLQDGDRFYYLSRTAGLNLLVQLEGNSFAELISRNSDADGLPADVFSRPDYKFDLSVQRASGAIIDDPATEYDETQLLRRAATGGQIRFIGGEHVVMIGSPRNDSALTDLGDDTLRGADGNDRLEGQAGNDSYIGGEGDDIITDTFGDDVLKGGPGDDALHSGPGIDLNQSGTGNDFVVGGSDGTETFGGAGNDMIFAGQNADTVFGDDGDDWIEGGNQNDLLQGDNGAPFQDDPNTPGHDVIDGDGGNDDYDAEGGDDIMVAGPGIERNEGILGFDWVTHKGDPTPANADFEFTGLLPDTLDNNRDRFDLVEAISGWTFADTLRGDDQVSTDLVGHELTAEGIDRIAGLRDLLPAGTVVFNGGNILIGGAGGDVIEGRGGDDVINGDAWLNVQLRVPDLATPDPADTRLVDNMGAVQADVFAGRMDPGSISIARTIETAPAGTDVDTAVFSGPRAEYDITPGADGVVVVHARGTAVDGTDVLRNIERVQFTDQTIDAVFTAPDAPSITSVVRGDGQVAVNFTAPESDGGAPITEFQVEVLTGGVVQRTVTGIAPTATSTVVTGLTNGTEYTFRVLAVNAAGTSAPSAASEAVTPRPPLTVPAAPAAPVATAGGASATVTWVAPADGGSPITEYRLQVRRGTTLVQTLRIDPSTTSQVVTGLTNGTAYTFRVRAVNAQGLGAFSPLSNTVTPRPAAPFAPVIGTAVAGNGSATVRWTVSANGGSPILRHEVQVFTGTSTTPVRTVRVAGANASSTTVTGLANGTAYTFRVVAVNARGAGPASAVSNSVTPVVPLTAPGAPRNVTATRGAAGGEITASVRWTPPASDGNSPITGYRVRALRMSANGNTVLQTVTSAVQAGAARSLTMTLPRTGNYRFTVQAVNAVGNGPQSTRSNQVAGR